MKTRTFFQSLYNTAEMGTGRQKIHNTKAHGCISVQGKNNWYVKVEKSSIIIF